MTVIIFRFCLGQRYFVKVMFRWVLMLFKGNFKPLEIRQKIAVGSPTGGIDYVMARTVRRYQLVFCVGRCFMQTKLNQSVNGLGLLLVGVPKILGVKIGLLKNHVIFKEFIYFEKKYKSWLKHFNEKS
uniref:(northern house mosquito) hypothetical protein n=1 Tax=Culex pipiens TaxID=7175 RepID=A0A8D8CLE5_CULPI